MWWTFFIFQMYETLSENFLRVFIEETDEKLYHNSYQFIYYSF